MTYPVPVSTQPPLDTRMPAGAQDLFLGVMSIGALVIVGYGVILAWRTRSAIPVFVLIGAAVAVVYEPLGDLLGNCLHAPVGQYRLLETNDHPVPTYVVPVYVIYLASLPLAYWKQMQDRTLTRRTVWTCAGVAAVGVVIIEHWPILTGIWSYYGEQSVRIGELPLWVPFVNGAAIVIPMLLVYRLLPVLVGWRQLAVIGLIPLGLGWGHAGTGLFMYNALGTDTETTPPGLMLAACVATAVLATLAVWVMTEICLSRETHSEERANRPESFPAEA